MGVTWEPVEGPVYIYVQLADHIAARIESGELRSGARLPNEGEMMEEYGVALSTVRRTLAELRDRGLVVTVPAKGTYVR
jgi:GntR family transcriptional regulator